MLFFKSWEQRALKNNPIICVDFDGVIHSYTSGWKGIDVIPDEPVEGAIEWLLSMLPAPEDLDPFGCELDQFVEGRFPVVQIYSSRSIKRKGRKAMKQWLIKNGVHPGYIRDNILLFPTKKPPAYLTIDDRAICFDGNFPSRTNIASFKPWYKMDVKRNVPDIKSPEPDVLAPPIVTVTYP